MEEREEAEPNYLRCPFCSCVFFTKTDLDKHLAAFGNGEEQHREGILIKLCITFLYNIKGYLILKPKASEGK